MSYAQPAAADISDLAASATTDTTNAGNLVSGTLPAARLPQFTGGQVTTTAAGSVNLTIGSGAVTDTMLAGSIATSKLASRQGTAPNVLTAGTVTGTGATLCTDAAGSATTSGCTAGHAQNTDTGTNQSAWQIESGNGGPKLKNNAGTLEVRNAADTGYAAFHVGSLQTGDGTTAGYDQMNELAANGSHFRKWLAPDFLTADLTMLFPDATPSAGDTLIFGAPVAGVSTMAFGKPGVAVQDEGLALTQRPAINFTGAGVTCADNASASRTDCTIPASGGAPSDAHYLTTQGEAGLSAESNLGALSTGLLKVTVSAGVGTPSTAAVSPNDGTGDYVGPTDSRLSNARTPTAHAASHAAGQADAVTPAAIGAIPAQAGTGALVVIAGTVQKAAGTSTDCLHVDGSSATCGAGASTAVGRKQTSVTFTAIADGACQQQTASWSGISSADTLIAGWPSSLGPGLFGGVRVSAADTVAVRLCNLSGAPVTPGALSINLTTAVYNLSGSGTIDFGSIADGACAASTFGLTGVAAGDPIAPKWPAGLEAGLFGSMVATAANTVQVRLCNLSGSAVDPASASFGASVAK